MGDDTNEINIRESYLGQGGTLDKSNELYERNALGNIASQLYPGYGEFFAVPREANHELYELLSAFVKHDRDCFEYVGSLRKNGGILTAGTSDLLHILRPHLHSSSKKNVDRYLIALRPPFTRRVNEFLVNEFVGRPEGKLFSWIDLGTTQIEYVDPVKLTERIRNLKVDQDLPKLSGKTSIYILCKVWSKLIMNARETRPLSITNGALSENSNHFFKKIINCDISLGKQCKK